MEPGSILTQSLTEPNKGKSSGEGHDRRFKKKFLTRGRVLAIVAGIIFIALVGYGISTLSSGKTVRVDKDKVTIATVERGPFQEYIPVTGNVLPRTTVYLDAESGGRVDEKFVLEGTQVTKGQPLLRLSNNDLQLRLISADAQRIEQINRVQDTRLRLEQNALNLRQQLAQMDYNITRLERDLERNREMFDKNLISEREYQLVKDEYDYYINSKALTLQGYQQDSLRMSSQLVQMEASVSSMNANYRVIQQVLDNLTIRAPVSGHLTSFSAEIGELRQAGDRFGQIDVLDGNKVRAGVDEFYIARVQRGQVATTQPIGGVEYSMTVTRVYPEVLAGRFEVDLEFTGETPPGIRRGQTIRFRLEMSDPEEAMLIPKGGFFQTTGGNWVYVLDSSGDAAVKRNIRLSRQNPQFLEVVDGLQPGEQVITSSYDSFGNADRVILN
ncbi:MAG: HlyD family efflux transporter periplasmic adaptor subunit [Rhodothermales bacterium]|nr:HlyD family efflux transporter periplasmic adaptor subunit [Rhodothermales bacterium]